MEIARHWRLKQQRYNLVGEICPHCDQKMFPPRDVCTGCGQETKIPFKFGGKGKVYSYTTIYQAPADFEDQVPYTVALVKLKEGPLITAQLTDLDWHEETEIIDEEPRQVKVFDVKIGMPVEMVTRKLKVDGDPDRGQIIYGYKFRPVLKSS